jgi:hypothetical protein
MTLVVYKYSLGSPDPSGCIVSMPKDAQVQHAATQGSELCVWALVDDKAPLVPHGFLVVGTGWPLQGHPGRFVSTIGSGPFVWHVFDKGEILS